MAKPIKRQTWGNIDVFGLLNGISTWDDQYKSLKYVRKPFETALELRNKIYRFHDYSGGITSQHLLNGLSNEFNINPYNVTNKNTFNLTYPPQAMGATGVSDVSGYYKTPSGEWISFYPQVWSENYLDYKNLEMGFIVWEESRSNNISGVKNYSYSNLVEVLEKFDDEIELKFIYTIYQYDENNNRIPIRFTDMNSATDYNDDRFTYRKTVSPPSGSVICYSLDTIPTGLISNYYQDTGEASEFLYTIKDHLNRKYKHKWNEITDNSCIWDIHKHYGSGEIPHFFDASTPRTSRFCPNSHNPFFSGYIGGVENKSDALYPSFVLESGEAQSWYLTVYPGKFYIDGIPFYMFENPGYQSLEFYPDSNNLMFSYLPAGVTRGSHIILTATGFYNNPCNSVDPILSGFVYEDYNYPTGSDGDSSWSNIFRRKPFLTIDTDNKSTLDYGEYYIDFNAGKIYTYNQQYAEIRWENNILPSGRCIEFDMNPLNNQVLSLEGFFMYLSLNRTI